MLTLPVGTGWLGWPVTVTKSWTVVPTATVVTVWWAALWMSVAVVEVSCWISASEAAADVRRVRVAVRVAGPGRVVAQVVPAERRVVLELVARQREVGGLDGVVAER